jgi:hypothetical protein
MHANNVRAIFAAATAAATCSGCFTVSRTPPSEREEGPRSVIVSANGRIDTTARVDADGQPIRDPVESYWRERHFLPGDPKDNP